MGSLSNDDTESGKVQGQTEQAHLDEQECLHQDRHRADLRDSQTSFGR